MINKNQLIHDLKDRVKTFGNRFVFDRGTWMVLDYYDDYLNTELISIYLKGGVLYLESRTEEHGIDTDKLSDFHQTIVSDIYNVVESQFYA